MGIKSFQTLGFKAIWLEIRYQLKSLIYEVSYIYNRVKFFLFPKRLSLFEQIVNILEYAQFAEYAINLPVDVEVPNNNFGNYSTNLAMKIASQEGLDSLEVAKRLKEEISAVDYNNLFERIEVSPPGFLNFWISKDALRKEFIALVKKK